MKIFIINLKKSVEKKEYMINLLNKYNIQYEFFEGIDGSKLNVNDYKANLDWINPCDNSHTKLGEIGCSLSHYYLWKKIIEKNIESAIILEDDIEILNDNFINLCENIDTKLYDLIYLGRKKMLNIEENISDFNNLLVKPCFSYWCCSYMLTYNGAKKICHKDYLNNLIINDEYLPYIACYSNHFNNDTQKILDKSYIHIKNNIGVFNTYAFEPPLIKPRSKAFNYSSTYHSINCKQFRNDILCVSVATDKNDCYERYIRSCNNFGIDPIILGMGEKWLGGNMKEGPGGGFKINLLKKFINNINENKLLIFTDCYDVIMNNNVNILIEKYYNKYNNKIVFACEKFCWPNKKLINLYPENNYKLKYLNSGLFIGFTNDIKELLDKINIKDIEDDQLYYTLEFLNNENIILDYECILFLCINGITENLYIDKNKNCINYDNIRPVFLHGNGGENIKTYFNNIITNYTINYNNIYGNLMIKYIDNDNDKKYENIIFLLHEVTNNKYFFQNIFNLDIDFENITFILFYEKKLFIDLFYKFYNNLNKKFKNIIEININNKYNIWSALISILNNIKYDYLFYCNNEVNLTNKNTLSLLINSNKKIVSPILKIDNNSLFSNFWGDLDNNGFYKRSINYLDIIKYNERGIFSVPYISRCILFEKNIINENIFLNNFKYNIDYDMLLCKNIRNNNNLMYINNLYEFGHLVNNENNENNENNDYELINLISIENNKEKWENKYLNKDYKIHYLGNNIHKIFLFNETFCNDIINYSEKNGKWSKGGETYFDYRLNAKENYPTTDIHLNEIGLKNMWDKIVDYYIKPFMINEYQYYTKDINISFIAKYSLDGQKELKPHHDSSTYTVNVCLNNNFEGGGCNFIRDNITIVNKDIGSLIIHPGKVTHRHQGLELLKGIRYILVSFIN